MKRYISLRVLTLVLSIVGGFAAMRGITPKQAPELLIESKTSIDTVEAMVEREQLPEPEPVLRTCEVMPEFPGGSMALQTFIVENLNYPEAEAANDIEGKVIVQFVVEKDGSIGEVRLVRGVTPGLDREAIRICMLLPNFEPGMEHGQPCRVWFTLPIVFKIN